MFILTLSKLLCMISKGVFTPFFFALTSFTLSSRLILKPNTRMNKWYVLTHIFKLIFVLENSCLCFVLLFEFQPCKLKPAVL